MSGEDSAYKIKLPFSGKKEDWDLWDMKFSAIAQEKGWHEVLNESVKPSTTSDGKRDSSDAKKKKVWRKIDAISVFFLLNLSQEALLICQVNRDNPVQTYKTLKSEYRRSEVRDYVKLVEEFAAVKLSDCKTPQEMILKLCKINQEMEQIKKQYKKDDATLIATTMALLPSEYGPFKSGIKVDKTKFANYTIYEFRTELKEWFEDNVEPTKKQAEQNFATERQEKNCTICKRRGHDNNECWFKDNNNNNNNNSNNNRKYGKKNNKYNKQKNTVCYNCGKKGHISVNCRSPKKTVETNDSLFIGCTKCAPIKSSPSVVGEKRIYTNPTDKDDFSDFLLPPRKIKRTEIIDLTLDLSGTDIQDNMSDSTDDIWFTKNYHDENNKFNENFPSVEKYYKEESDGDEIVWDNIRDPKEQTTKRGDGKTSGKPTVTIAKVGEWKTVFSKNTDNFFVDDFEPETSSESGQKQFDEEIITSIEQDQSILHQKNDQNNFFEPNPDELTQITNCNKIVRKNDEFVTGITTKIKGVIGPVEDSPISRRCEL